MALRITCPSCSTQLSVRDEFAGRSVKCPKCAAVIPPEAGAAPAAPPPAPAGNEVDDAFKNFTGPPPSAARPSARPVDDEDRPVRRPRDDEDDRERDRGDRDRDRDDRDRDRDDRGRPRRRPHDDDEDDDRGRPRRPRPMRGPPRESGGGGGKVLLIVGLVFLLLCAGVGFGIYWMVNKAKQAIEQVQEEARNPTTQWKFNAIDYNMSRTEVERVLGAGGRPATMADLNAAFPGGGEPVEKWGPKVRQGRVWVWQHEDDYLFVAFYPNANPDGRLQMKEAVRKSGSSSKDGYSYAEDADFEKQFPAPNKPPKSKTKSQTPESVATLSSVELAQAYADSPTEAEAKYTDKWVTVEGKISEIQWTGDSGPPGTECTVVFGLRSARPKKKGTVPVIVRCAPSATASVLNCSREQTITLKGKCLGPVGEQIELTDAEFVKAGPDTSKKVTAAELMAAYKDDESAADIQYGSDTELTITDAEVVKVLPDSFIVASSPAKGSKKGVKEPAAGIQIQVSYEPEWKKKFESIKPGDRVTIKGKCTGLTDGKVTITRAWLFTK
jgi:predicted Zn finger-like uncharacterized protein